MSGTKDNVKGKNLIRNKLTGRKEHTFHLVVEFISKFGPFDHLLGSGISTLLLQLVFILQPRYLGVQLLLNGGSGLSSFFLELLLGISDLGGGGLSHLLNLSLVLSLQIFYLGFKLSDFVFFLLELSLLLLVLSLQLVEEVRHGLLLT